MAGTDTRANLSTMLAEITCRVHEPYEDEPTTCYVDASEETVTSSTPAATVS